MSQEYRPPSHPTSRTRWFLVSAWAVMTAAALGLVLGFGHNAPRQDEWEFVPALTGHEPAGPWLWTQHNEHRLPLPRAVYLGLFRLTGDFRSGMVAQVLLLSGLALGLMRYLAWLRGRPAWADVFVPVGLLNWGHVENFLMGYQLCFALACALACGMLVAARSTRPGAWFRPGVLVGVQLLLLEACGGFGLPYALPVAAWLVVTGRRVSPTEWKKGADLVVLAALAVVYIGAYFVGYERPAHHPPPRPEYLGLAALIAAEYLSMSFGYGAAAVWPAVAAGVGGLAAATGWVLGRAGWADEADRPRAWGVLAVLLGALGGAAAVGVGRSGFGHADMGLWSRYGLLAWPVPFACYLAFTGSGGRFGRWVQPGLAAAALALLPANVAAGWQWASEEDRRQTQFATDIAAGVPVPELIRRHLEGSGQEERALRGMPMLRGAGVGPFRLLRDGAGE